MSILQKLHDARQFIKGMKIEKKGHNDYSDYKYYTPEQINFMVNEAEKETGLIHFFSLIRDEHGLHGHLKVVEIETKEEITFIQATDIPQIKATNVAQQIGGSVTYTNRYLCMVAFDISDNYLDYDQKVKPFLPDHNLSELIKLIKEKPERAAVNIKAVKERFRLTDSQEFDLMEWESTL